MDSSTLGSWTTLILSIFAPSFSGLIFCTAVTYSDYLIGPFGIASTRRLKPKCVRAPKNCKSFWMSSSQTMHQLGHIHIWFRCVAFSFFLSSSSCFFQCEHLRDIHIVPPHSQTLAFLLMSAAWRRWCKISQHFFHWLEYWWLFVFVRMLPLQ